MPRLSYKQAKKKEQQNAAELANLLEKIEQNFAKPSEKKQITNTIIYKPSAYYNVNNILFTQETISHQFTNAQYTITKNMQLIVDKYHQTNRKTPYNLVEIQNILNTNLTLDVLHTNTNKIYSCNNRRLCMLKRLHNTRYFDGNVFCNSVMKCGHNTYCTGNCQNVHIQMGSQKGKKCSNFNLKKAYT